MREKSNKRATELESEPMPDNNEANQAHESKQLEKDELLSEILQASQVKYLRLSEIIQPELPMRDKLDGTELNSLAENIRKLGLINPITVRYTKKGYEIIAGVRRYHAHKVLMREDIAAICFDGDEKSVLLQRWAENMERASINPQEEASYLMSIQTKYNLTQAELAKLLNKSIGYVNDRLQILKYPSELYTALEKGLIEFSTARELNRINDRNRLLDALKWCVSTGANARTARQYAEDINRDLEYQPEEEEERPERPQISNYTPEKVYMSCNLCKTKVDINQTYLIRACQKCYNQIIA